MPRARSSTKRTAKQAGRTRGAAKRTPKEEVRLQDPLSFERGFWSRGLEWIAGVDEVGRGPLAGPVVAAAVVLPHGCECLEGVDDSKKLQAEHREELVHVIVASARAIGIGAASPREIDRLNIRRATALAMQRALRRLPAAEHLLVDGLPVPELGLELQTAVVEGDSHVHSIACASIIAKVCRDRLMRRLAPRYPVYGWERNKGYATPEHREALDRHGPTPHHRLSFEPVQQLSIELTF